jgi:Spy/CpxP family protein refolding chaperone
MKSFHKALALATVVTAAAWAQGPFGPMTSATPPDPATIVQHQVDRLTNRLGLSTAQAAQATTIFTNVLNAITPLQTQMSTARQSLIAAIKSNNGPTIDQVSSTIGSLSGQIMAIQNKADAAFYATLTSDQQTKLGNNLNFGLGFGGPGFGGPRGPGGNRFGGGVAR